MNIAQSFQLSGIAVPQNAEGMLDEICDHFVEHSRVERTGDRALLTSEIGTASIRTDGSRLLIALACPSEEALQMSCNIFAEHLFYFAGDEPFELTWSTPAPPAGLPDLRHVTVVSTENVTPLMRRLIVTCDDVTPYVDGDMHIRVLVPPKGRTPVWPTFRPDGRTAWPDGDDEILVRVYTIRKIDIERRELWIDFLQHPSADAKTPGADFARDAQPGDTFAILGPGGGSIPEAEKILIAGDESALPAIARIAAEVPAGTRMQAIIEVMDAAEEQPLPTAGTLDVTWLHRRSYPAGATGVLHDAIRQAITEVDDGTYIWFACEKTDVRSIRKFLKGLGHPRDRMYAAWYWEK